MKPLDNFLEIVDKHVVADAMDEIAAGSRRERMEARYVMWLEAKCDELERTVAGYAKQEDQTAKLQGMMSECADLKASFEQLRDAMLSKDTDERLSAMELRLQDKEPLPAMPMADHSEKMAQIESRISAIEAAHVSMVEDDDDDEAEQEVQEYDIDILRNPSDDTIRSLRIESIGKTIDVVRDGANRIRTLRVRQSNQP